MKKYIYIFAALLAGAVACNQEINTEIAPEPEMSHVLPAEIFATIDNDETKAGWEYNSSEKTYTHHWDTGDQIYVGFNSKLGTYKINSAADAQAGRFTFVSEIACEYTSTTEYVALYSPVSLGSNPIKSNHFYVNFGTGFESNYATYMVARGTDTNLSFKHVTGWLKLQLLGCKEVSSLVVTSSANIAGELKIGFDGTPTNYFDETPIQFSYATPIQLHEETPTPFYIPMIPGGYEASKMSIFVYFSDGSYQKINPTKDFTITRNHVLPKKATTVGAITPWVNSAQDKRANCYVVDVTTQSATYKFDARYKGNSSTDEIVGAHHARVLWESKMTPQAPIASGDIVNNVRYSDGRIYFTVPEHAYGNAVIALCDSSNNILWSWHIWSPGHAVTTDVYDFSTKSAGLKFMKYDLGQVDGVNDHLRYQWGRKDPFVRMAKNLDANSKAVFLPAGIFTFTYSTPSIDASVANPTTDYENWENLKNVELWKDDVKTKYDPCPAGWRVQSKTKLEKVLNREVNDYYTDGYSIPESSVAYMANLGIMFVDSAGDFNLSAGDRYWTSYSEARTGNLADFCYCLNRASTNSRFMLTNAGNADNFAAVRCIAE